MHIRPQREIKFEELDENGEWAAGVRIDARDGDRFLLDGTHTSLHVWERDGVWVIGVKHPRKGYGWDGYVEPIPGERFESEEDARARVAARTLTAQRYASDLAAQGVDHREIRARVYNAVRA